MEYIAKLRKHFPVALYGNCFGLKVSMKLRMKIIRKYRFILSFENSHCHDYNTEKYWHGIKYGAIPIVMGHDKNHENLIPDSYIDVMNYTHPYYLAKHLRKINDDFELYKKYHEWRKFYTIKIDNFEMDSCQILKNIQKYLAENMLFDDTIDKIGDYLSCINANNLTSQIISRI